ncbi:hypothetical protein HK102_004276 [Quaeritorhiza haematococci]|nr:hypothetical protein HK102_004276 [Quaeritorhiza haematococci]
MASRSKSSSSSSTMNLIKKTALLSTLLCLGLFSNPQLLLVDAQDVKKAGEWNIVANSRVICIHTALLPNYRIWCAERPHVAPYPANSNTGGETAVEIDITNDTAVITNVRTNPFCSGHAQMANGNLLVVGGDEAQSNVTDGSGQIIDGRRSIREYDTCLPGTPGCNVGAKWREASTMTTGRWYPTITTLKDGSQLITSGTTSNLDFTKPLTNNNPTIEYWPPKQGTFPLRLDILDATYPFNLYPPVYQLPDGRVMFFVANRTAYLNPDDQSITEPVPVVQVEDKMPWIYPYTPTSVMLPLTQANNYTASVMVCGGSRLNLNADNRCIMLNTSDPSASWQQVDPMPVARVMPDSCILPDGTILFSNGAGGGLAGGAAGESTNAWNPVLEVDIYDPLKPTGSKWSQVAPMTVPRLYHSGIVLLPDARVLISGSEMQNYVDVQQNRTDCYPFAQKACTSPFEYRLEVFSPPYLFKSVERPVIKTAPTNLTYTSSFTVTTETDATTIDFVSFIRYSTSTHSTNMDQRLVELKILGANKTHIVMEAPSNGALAPPGNWMLFLMREGKPSVAATVLLGVGEVTRVPQSDIPELPKRGGDGGNGGGAGSRSAAGGLRGGVQLVGVVSALLAATALLW